MNSMTTKTYTDTKIIVLVTLEQELQIFKILSAILNISITNGFMK